MTDSADVYKARDQIRLGAAALVAIHKRNPQLCLSRSVARWEALDAQMSNPRNHAFGLYAVGAQDMTPREFGAVVIADVRHGITEAYHKFAKAIKTATRGETQ